MNTKHRSFLLASFLLVGLTTSSAFAADELFHVSTGAPEYSPAKLEEATLNSVGSDSMGGLVEQWVLAYKKVQPTVVVNVLSRGSASAPAALIEGSADIGPMSRPMKEGELEEFKEKYGFAPTQFKTAMAGVAIYVSKENPLESISFEQLDALYSASGNRATGKTLATWGELGVKGNLAKQPIMTVGVDENSYANSFFRQQVMLQGNFVSGLTSTSDERSLLETISANPGAIGFGAIAPTNGSKVKILAVRKDNSDHALKPTAETLTNGKYSLGRFLSVYVASDPNSGLEATTKDFLRFVLSNRGQKLVVTQGLVPLPGSVLKAELTKLKN